MHCIVLSIGVYCLVLSRDAKVAGDFKHYAALHK